MRRRSVLVSLGASGLMVGCGDWLSTPEAPPPAPPTPEPSRTSSIADLLRRHDLPPEDAELIRGILLEIEGLGRGGVVALDPRGEAGLEPTQQDFESSLPALDAALVDKLVENSSYWSTPADQRLTVGWAKVPMDLWFLDERNDYADASVVVDAGLLQDLADANAFSFRPWAVSDRRIFGLRGATLSNPATAATWSSSHEITVTQPNHRDLNCVIGVWHQREGIQLFKASTVPDVASMYTSLRAARGWGTSLLPCGLYEMISGTHGISGDHPKPASLRIATPGYYVLRTTGDLIYTVGADSSDVFTTGSFHNLHATCYTDQRLRKFNSQGCQVIQGCYLDERTTSDSAWRNFQIAAGLADATGTFLSDGRPYQYMLLPAVEAAHIRAGHAPFRALRPGSSGPMVTDLQNTLFEAHVTELRNTLGRDPEGTGTFDEATTLAVLFHQGRKGDGDYLTPTWPNP